MESILRKAKELERKYDWLQALKLYEEVLNSHFYENNCLESVNLQEKIGFCFYRAAMQSKSNSEFRKLIKHSIIAYEKEAKILEKVNEKKYDAKINHANASVAYVMSWLKINAKKRKDLLDKWWILENKALEAYESSGDLISVGKTCNDLSEYSSYNRFWLGSNYSEHFQSYKEGIRLAEKSIKIFLKLNDKFELARAYWIASFYYSFSDHFWEDKKEAISLLKKSQEYANKALKLAKEINEAYIIGRSYQASWNVAQMLHFEPKLAIEIGEKLAKYGAISKDNYLIGSGKCLAALSIWHLSRIMEDPDKEKEYLSKIIKMNQQATHYFNIINEIASLNLSITFQTNSLRRLAEIETDIEKKRAILQNALRVNQEGLDRVRDWKRLGFLFGSLSEILTLITEFKTEIDEKRKLLNEAKIYQEKSISTMEEFTPFMFGYNSHSYYQLALILNGLATFETQDKKKVELLRQAAFSINKSLELVQKQQEMLQSEWASGLFGIYYDKLGGIIKKIFHKTKEKKRITEAIEAYESAASYFRKANMPTHIAESHWNIAQLYDQLNDLKAASDNYKFSAQSFDAASKTIQQLKKFYTNYSKYMLAWSEIEQARHSHSIEDYDKAKEHYKKSAELHQKSDSWSYLAPNYFAWSNVEEAEGLSRKENPQQAKEIFQKAYEQFYNAEKSFNQKLEEITSSKEREITQRLFEASAHRRDYCQARILMEEAKLLDRKGKYLQSSKCYREASKKILSITEAIDGEAERKELKYIAILCQAWEKMANAEETTSSESFLEAAALFKRAKDYCYTRKASLWAFGNSNFCMGLAAGVEYQTSLDLTDHTKAKGYIKTASTNYLQAGFKNASEYAKATQRLFDAYVYINQAEGEIDQEKRARQYQMAENLLQIAAGSFTKSKQPEKTAQVQRILTDVREEKALAVSLSQVMQAPTLASSTSSFAAPSPTREASVGLEQFQHANVQANLIAGLKEVKVGESFCLTVEFVNAGKEPALLTRVEDFVPPDFVVVKKPEIYRLEETCLNMKGKQIAPLKLVEAKIVLQPSKKGIYQLKPTVHYLDELGQNKSLQLKSAEIKVEEVVLADRVSTGTRELDSLLLGGIPKEYAVVLTGPPSDERELLIKNLLEEGVQKGQPVFFVTAEADNLESLLNQSNFHLFLCNLKPKTKVPDLPNVTRLKSKTDLTNLNIALLKAYRNIEQSSKKRMCLDIVSDVLLRHGAEATRRWISELTMDMISKGFTVLAVMNPGMHPADQATAVVDLFDGEIELSQTDDPLDCKKSIRVKKLRNQDYIKNPICFV